MWLTYVAKVHPHRGKRCRHFHKSIGQAEIRPFGGKTWAGGINGGEGRKEDTKGIRTPRFKLSADSLLCCVTNATESSRGGCKHVYNHKRVSLEGECWDIWVTDAFGRYLIIVDLLHNRVQRSSHAGRADTSQLYQQVETWAFSFICKYYCS